MNKRKKIVAAICYDFDQTLATQDMQSYKFIPSLGMTPDEFWDKCHSFANKTGTDNVLAYLKTMIDECDKRNIPLTKDYLYSLGKDIVYFEGVKTWFKRINEYALENNIILEHYIISSGNKEILEGTEIAKEFKNIFGCEFLYNNDGIAYWPKSIINYTLKTQYLFRIVKGATKLTDNETVNQRISKKHVEFRNIIYIGDGMTDIPAMTLVKEKGGYAISVYKEENKQASIKLVEDDRVNYACVADYRANSQLSKLIKLIIDSIGLKEELFLKETKAIK